MASGLLAALAVTVVLYGLSTLTNAILQGIGKVNSPVIHAVIALAVQVAGLVALLLFTDMDTYALAAANIIYSLVMCILNQASVAKHLDYHMDYMRIFIKPGFAALVMGAVAYGVYKGIYLLFPVNRVVLLIVIAVGAVVYFVVLLKIGGVSETELRAFPKGTMLVQYAERLHLLRAEAEVPQKKKRKKKKRRRKRKRRL